MRLTENFSTEDFSYPCCGDGCVSSKTIWVLEVLTKKFGHITINSGYRCVQNNKEVGGVQGSKHLKGLAVDFEAAEVTPIDVQNYLLRLFPHQYGIGRYARFTRFDTREGCARW